MTLLFGTPISYKCRNFGRLVLGCIDTSDSETWHIFQYFSSSTRFAFLCTVPNSEILQNFVKSFVQFSLKHCNFGIFQLKFVVFRMDFDEKCRNFTKLQQNIVRFLPKIIISRINLFRKNKLLRHYSLLALRRLTLFKTQQAT